jgi:hypothetical protein
MRPSQCACPSDSRRRQVSFWHSGRLRVELAFNSWLLGFLGLLFVPWATLMYVIVYPVHGFDWVFLGLALLADIVSYSGGAFNRRRVPGYRGP